MAKTKTIFYCTSCGYESPKWVGRCPGCGEWNTMEEQPVIKSVGGKAKPWKPAAKPVPLAQVDVAPAGHIQTGIEELDRVLGGGLIEGAVVLVGGEPGVGKSTLLLQACERIARQGKKGRNRPGRSSCGRCGWARCLRIYWCWRKQIWRRFAKPWRRARRSLSSSIPFKR